MVSRHENTRYAVIGKVCKLLQQVVSEIDWMVTINITIKWHPILFRIFVPLLFRNFSHYSRKEGRKEGSKEGSKEGRKEEGRKAGRQKGRKAGRQEGRKTERQKDRKAGRQKGSKTERQKDRYSSAYGLEFQPTIQSSHLN